MPTSYEETALIEQLNSPITETRDAACPSVTGFSFEEGLLFRKGQGNNLGVEVLHVH